MNYNKILAFAITLCGAIHAQETSDIENNTGQFFDYSNQGNYFGLVSGDGRFVFGETSSGSAKWEFNETGVTLPAIYDTQSILISDSSQNGGIAVGVGDHPTDASEYATIIVQANGELSTMDEALSHYTNHEAEAISDDGEYITGNAFDGEDDVSFIWSEAAGAKEISLLPGFTESRVRAISNDGSTVVGEVSRRVSEEVFQREAFRYDVATDTMTSLGVPEGYHSSDAKVVSKDGSIIFGSCSTTDSEDEAAFRWSASEGFDILGTASEALEFFGVPSEEILGTPLVHIAACSADGNIVVVNFINSKIYPAIWNHETQELQQIPSYLENLGLKPTIDRFGTVEDISDTGKVIVGENWIARLGEETPEIKEKPIQINGEVNTSQLYTFSVPSGLSSFTVNTSGGTGDIDLLLKANSSPTATNYDWSSLTASSNAESIQVVNPDAGVYHVMITGQSTYSDVSLWVDFEEALQQVSIPVIIPTSVGSNVRIDPSEVINSDGPIKIVFICATDGITLRYTTDGSAVTANSKIYRGMFTSSVSGTVRVKAFKEGMAPSEEAEVTCNITNDSNIITYVPNVPIHGLSGKAGVFQYIQGTVPFNQADSSLQIRTTDALYGQKLDIYFAFGRMPTRTNYDYKSDTASAWENLILTPEEVQTGDYYILIYGETNYLVNLESNQLRPMVEGVELQGLSGFPGRDRMIRKNVRPDQVGKTLIFEIYGGAGNADLYGSYRQIPLAYNHEYKSDGESNGEKIVIPNAKQGDYYFKIKGYFTYYSGLSVRSYIQ